MNFKKIVGAFLILIFTSGCANVLVPPTLAIKAQHGEYQAVAELLNKGENPNKMHTGFTLLMRAAGAGAEEIFIDASGKMRSKSIKSDGNYQTVKVLLENGADPNIQTSDGFTALHYASQYGEIASAELFLQYKANTNSRNKWGTSPLLLSAKNGHKSTSF